MNAITNIITQLAYMVWDIYWCLALGFILSSLIRAFISTESISARFGKDSVTALTSLRFSVPYHLPALMLPLQWQEH